MASRSNVHRQVFWRRVRSGLRTSIAALLAAVLALTPQISSHLTIAFFASVTAIIITDSSIGRTIHNAVMVFWACVASSVTSLISVAIFGRSYTAMLLCLTVTAFLIAYPEVHVLIKKFGLALAGIDFITFAIRPHSTPITFPLNLSVTTMLGAACAVASMIVPMPLRATSLVRDRAELAAKSMAALLSTQMDAFCALEARSLSRLRVQAGMLRQAVVYNLQSMRDREGDLWWEMAGGAPTRKLKRLLKVFDTILMHSASLDLALQTGHIHESPKLLLRVLKQPLVDVGVWTGLALSMAVEDFKGKQGKPEKAEQIAASGTELLKQFNATLQLARERAYYGLKTDANLPDNDLWSSDEDDDKGPILKPTVRQRRRRRVESLMKCSVESLITSQFFLFNARHIAQEALSLINSAPTPTVQTPRRSSIQSMRPDHPCKNPDCASSNRRVSHPDALAAKSLRSLPDATAIRMPEGGSQADAIRPPGISGRVSGKSEKDGRWAGVLHFARRFKPDGKKVKGGARVAISVGVAGVLGVVAARDYGYWGVVTVAFIIGGYQGGSFRAAFLRLQGTVAGAVYGYLVILLVHGHPVAVGALLVPWVALVTFIRYSKAYGYSGVVAGFTAAIIALGYRSSNQKVQEYALGRITETCIGIVTFIVVETCLWPNRAASLVREALICTLQDSRACFAAIVRSYMEDECPWCRQKAMNQVADTEKSIKALVGKQGPLIDEAASEPDFWRAPFPVPVYSKLVDLQKRMARLLYAMDCALRAAGMETSGEQTDKLVKPLQGPLRSLEAEVLLTLDSLIIALKSPNRAFEAITKPPQKEHATPEADLTAAAAAVSRPQPAGVDLNTVRQSANGGAEVEVEQEKKAGRQSAALENGNDEIESGRWKTDHVGVANGMSGGSEERTKVDRLESGHRRMSENSLYSKAEAADQGKSVDIESQAEPGRSDHVPESGGRSTASNHHKHRGVHHHRTHDKKPVDGEVFDHPMPGVDAGGRLGTAGAVNIRHVFREFEDRYEDVISGLISVKLANPGLKIVDNTSMLSFNALIFSMRALIAEANELEVTVRELLQVESPIDLLKCIPSFQQSQTEPLLTRDEKRQK